MGHRPRIILSCFTCVRAGACCVFVCRGERYELYTEKERERARGREVITRYMRRLHPSMPENPAGGGYLYICIYGIYVHIYIYQNQTSEKNQMELQMY